MELKKFTIDNVANGRIQVGVAQLAIEPLDWQRRGLQQTASGYGKRLTSRYKIHFEGKLRRIYFTQFSNAGSAWFNFQGKKIHVN